MDVHGDRQRMTTEEKTVGLLRGRDDQLRTFAGSFRLLNFGRAFMSQKRRSERLGLGTCPPIAAITRTTALGRSRRSGAVSVGNDAADQIIKAVQPLVPFLTVIVDPILQRREPGRIELTGAHPSKLGRAGELGFLKNCKVLAYRCLADRQYRSKFRNARGLLRKMTHYATAIGVTQRMKQKVDPRRADSLYGRLHHAGCSSEAIVSSRKSHPIRRIAGPSAPSK